MGRKQQIMKICPRKKREGNISIVLSKKFWIVFQCNQAAVPLFSNGEKKRGMAPPKNLRWLIKNSQKTPHLAKQPVRKYLT